MKKNLLPFTIAAFFVIVITILLIISLNNDDKYKDYEIIEISYSYGGGFGTIIDASKKTITFTPNGKVKLSNSYNSYTEIFSIDQDKYKELNDFIIENISLFDEKPKEDENVLDGGSSRIQIKLKDGQIKEIGGYMIKNKKYTKIKNKIYETIDSEKLSKYEKNIENNE